MTPEQFLIEECENVRRALDETLRYEYGPNSTDAYYQECKDRLSRIEKAIPRTRSTQIWARLDELASLAGWISLIERSRLGEFSWPFAEEIRSLAKLLLAETDMRGPIEPIVHVVAEGEGYQIVYERILSVSGRSRFAIVAFPRPLKHHVLLHTIFGHELGHTAQDTTAIGHLLTTGVRDVLSSSGPLSSVSEFNKWLNDSNAPAETKRQLIEYQRDYGASFAFEEFYRQKWLIELICDLFGLLLFGPGFAAAHQVLLKPYHRTAYDVGLDHPTHPPYAARHKMIVQAMSILGWPQPVTTSKQPHVYDAEIEALKYILTDPYDTWAALFDDKQLSSAIQGLQKALSTYGSLGYAQPSEDALIALTERLSRRLPPIVASIDSTGTPRLSRTSMAHALYAGWVYWLGRAHLSSNPLSFFETNRLCDQALLQERAIALA